MKAKKILSIVLASILLVGCIGITASAEAGTVTVSLLGEKQAVATEEYEVTLNVQESSQDLVGGIYAEITYEAEKFTLDRIEVSAEFAEANNIATDKATDLIDTSTDGKIVVALLDIPNDNDKNNWLTFVFTVEASQEATAKFELENVSASDAVGVDFVTNSLKVDVTEEIYNHIIDVNGASIRKDAKGNIRFEAEIDANVDKTKVAEVGFLMIPAVCLKDGLYNGDLTLSDKYITANGKMVTVATNKIDKADDISKIFDNDNKFYCYLANTQEYSLSMAFAARAYVKLTDNTVIYSDNQTYSDASNTYEKDIKGGTSSKSCIETAKAIYEIYKDKAGVTFSDEFKSIISKDSWEKEEYTIVVTELAQVEDSFN